VDAFLYRVAFKKILNVGANLVFALERVGEHKVRPYKKYIFDDELVL
jgi:hypothetical protein